MSLYVSGGLLGQPLPGTGTNEDPVVLQPRHQLSSVDHPDGRMPTHHPARAVAGGAEGGIGLDAGEDVGGGPHRAGDENGLAHGTQVLREVQMPGRQRECGPFAVDAQLAGSPCDDVLFELGEVVGHVVDQVEPDAYVTGEDVPHGLASN
jgi:hypothetical protein